ncbi:MAG: hypothetical protein K2X11_03290 [Acetobacteraceae bacterium]|nr:hypothetical protein [Acetobacteraceae bacterium]
MRLSRAVVALAIAWCVAFPVVGLWAQLHLFADGALFAYGVAAQDGWAFHFCNIPTRAAAFLLTSVPGQLWARLSGDAEAGGALYAALFFAAPGIGLAVTWFADRTGVIRLWAAASFALLCPLVFGFPTELWIGHAAFWPALALCWTVGGGWRWAGAAAALAITACSHEAGLLWAIGLVGLLVLAPDWRRALPRGALALLPGLALWAGLKWLVVPDPYVAEVMARVALTFADPWNLVTSLTVTLLAALAVYAAALFLLERGGWPGVGAAAGIAAAALLVWWLFLDPTLHAWARYHLRTLMALAVPMLAFLAALRARGVVEWRRPPRWVPVLIGALGVTTLVQIGETAKFVALWRGYVAEVRVLALSGERDPVLGDAEFVSSARLPARYERLTWHSTTPFLSVMAVPGLAPPRLVVDPAANYFWFGCATAAANASARRALPAETRERVRRYACLHRR